MPKIKIISSVPIHKGWSCDEKYCVTAEDKEFNRIVFSAQKAPIFACGIVNGYFDDEVPIEFWRLLALYMCSNALGSLSWAISFGEREVRAMYDQAEDILAWYDNMQKSIPTWYADSSV